LKPQRVGLFLTQLKHKVFGKTVQIVIFNNLLI